MHRPGFCFANTQILVASVVMALLSAAPVLGQGPAPAPAPAVNEDEARAHFLLGRSHHDKGQFAQAAAEFEKAYASSGKATLLYNLFVAYRDANESAKAADALRRYLRDEPNVENRPQLEAKLAAMEASLASQPTPPPAGEPAPEPAQPAEPPAAPVTDVEAASEPDEPSTFPVGPVVVMGVGGAMVLTSVITGIMASGKESDLEKGCPEKTNCPAELEDTKSSGETLALVTDVLLFGGLATAGAGLAWLLLGGSDGGEASEPAAAVYCGPGACGGSVRVSF
jgi:tetratricopeptide (TPR) repeat protein